MNDIDQHIYPLDEDYDEGIRKLAETVADKKVVGVGESTHGTHEFFQLKADLVCELITKHGFRTFALEDKSNSCQNINDYIQTGKGNLDELFKTLYAVWRTQEVKDLIIRLRDLSASYDIQFIGIDVESSELTEKPGKPMFEQRDKLMAGNTVEAAKVGKTFVWGHNSHVSKWHLDVRNLGRNLVDELGGEYVAVGQFFGRGTFNARKIPRDKKVAVEDYKYIPFKPIEAPAPKNGFIEDVLDKIDCKSYFIKLTEEDKLDILDHEYKCRAYGAISSGENLDKWPMKVRPYEYYDVLVYFKNTRHSETITAV